MIQRIGDYRTGEPFYYVYSHKPGAKIVDPKVLEWIKSLRIPPAYADVCIYTNRKDKILAFGFDSKNRKQYIYNPKFVEKQAKNKYKKILELNDVFNVILDAIKKDISSKDEKLRNIAIIIYLIIYCGFRIGNKCYERSNGSYGISTIKYSHLKFNASGCIIDFIGKKGVRNIGFCDNMTIRKILKARCKNRNSDDSRVFPGITSADVNGYLKQFHSDITSKDLRTWNANTLFIQYTKEAISNGVKNAVKAAIEKVSQQLHNTVAVCKKNYIDPEVIEAVERKIKNDI